MSSLCVIFSKNPVYSVLYLIFCFLNSSGFILFLGLEFLAIIFIIIYVGAIAVLFLFVVMMLDIKILEISDSFLKYLPINIFLFSIFFFELIYLFFSSYNFINFSQDFYLNFFFNLNFFFDFEFTRSSDIGLLSISNFYKNIQYFSSILYLDFFFIFWCAGLLLLLALIGAIILTLNKNLFIKRQSVYSQVNKNVSLAVVHYINWVDYYLYFSKKL